MRQRVLFASMLAATACLATCDISAHTAAPPGLEAIVGTFDCVTHTKAGRPTITRRSLSRPMASPGTTIGRSGNVSVTGFDSD